MFEEIDVSKTTSSRDCIFWHYRHFIEINFRFQLKVCDVCHDLMQKAMSFNTGAIASVKGNGSRIHFLYMSKDEAIHLLKKC